MTIDVFLLDDHEVVRRGVREMLENEGDIVVTGEAGTVADASRRIRLRPPDVALLDVRLPDGNGIELCRELRSDLPEIRCLLLTSFDDDDALSQAVMAGAAGYLLKQLRGTDIVDAVRRVAGGATLLDPAAVQRATDRARGSFSTDDRVAHLTDRERRILELLSEGLTNRQIAERLSLAEKTVKNYVSNVLAKMGFSHRTEAAVYAVRHERDDVPPT